MNLAYILNKNISATKMLADIEKQISKIKPENLSSTALVISFTKINDQYQTPLIEYKQD